MKPIIYAAPTKEIWKEIVQKWLDEGYVWLDGDKKVNADSWNAHKDDSVLALHYLADNKMTWADKRYHLRKGEKIMTYKKTLQTLEVGDYVKDTNGDIRRVLTAQGEGEYRTYILSWASKSLEGERLKQSGIHGTAYELERACYTVYTPEEKPTYTPDQAIDKLRELGHDCEIKK